MACASSFPRLSAEFGCSTGGFFTRRVLCPSVVLHELRGLRAPQIEQLCGISHIASVYQERRMKLLEERNMFYTSPTEREIEAQFHDFIMQNRVPNDAAVRI